MVVRDKLHALTVYLIVTTGKSLQYPMDMVLGKPRSKSGFQVLTDK